MKKNIPILILCATVFFAGGVGYGIWSRKHLRQELTERPALRVLCAENWLSTTVLDNFSHKHGIAIEQWTYANPTEFLHQMANADGNVDVICSSSFVLQSLINSHWVRKMDFAGLPNAQLISVDFTHLPYDPNSEYSIPLFWNLYGFFGKSQPVASTTLKQAFTGHRVGLWGDEMNLLQLMKRLGYKTDPPLEDANPHIAKASLNEEVGKFVRGISLFFTPTPAPFSAEAVLGKVEWAQLPLARVARLLEGQSPYRFWLPEDGGAVETGLLAVGSKSPQPELALKLINELISTEHALEAHARLDNAVVHSSLSHVGSIALLQTPEALRRFQLNRLRFPDLSVEDLPRFQKAFAETRAR